MCAPWGQTALDDYSPYISTSYPHDSKNCLAQECKLVPCFSRPTRRMMLQTNRPVALRACIQGEFNSACCIVILKDSRNISAESHFEVNGRSRFHNSA